MAKPTFLNTSRRDFLKGLAVTGLGTALPLERLMACSNAPARFLFIPLQHGWGTGNGESIMQITGSEFDYTLPTSWSSFNSIREHCVFVDGLRGTFWGNAHDVSYSDILTAAVPKDAPNRSDLLDGPFPLPLSQSIDHYLSEQHYQMPALRFSAGYRSFGAQFHPCSFNDRLDRLPYYTTSVDAYQAFFSSALQPEEDTSLTALFPQLTAETNALLNQVPEEEQNKLRSYLDGIGSLETRLSAQAGAGSAELNSVPQSGQSFDQEVDFFFDMIRVAFTNDTHRVAVLGLGEHAPFEWTNSDNTVYTGLDGIVDPQGFHHSVAHYNINTVDESHYAWRGWVEYYCQKITGFVQALASTTDVDGNPLIDNTIIVLTGEVGHGNHDRDSKPHIIIGGGGCGLVQNRWFSPTQVPAATVSSRDFEGALVDYRYPWETNGDGRLVSSFSHADLFVTLAQIAGANISSFGISEMNTQALPL